MVDVDGTEDDSESLSRKSATDSALTSVLALLAAANVIAVCAFVLMIYL